MKRKNKGKVFPSPTLPVSSPPQHQDGHFLSVLNLIPAAILSLVAVLSLEDREVLAYMIARSLDTPTKKLASRNAASGGVGGGYSHSPRLFQCECFDCYTAYWLRWDSSPNRELIHQVIEAFEEHLATDEQLKGNIRGKRRDKVRPRSELSRPDPTPEIPSVKELSPEGNVVVRAEEEPAMVVVDEEIMRVEIMEGADVDGGESQGAAVAGARNDHKGLARKVLPDVLGLLNSRLWKLWNPSM